jgi:hypothetical protein
MGPQGPQGIQGPPGASVTGPAGADGDNAYLYIAYAHNNLGSEFTTTFDPTKNWIGIITSTTPLTPTVDDFSGKWFNYKGATGATGATGPQGPPGLQGLPGFTGPAGLNGADGIDGTPLTWGVSDPLTPATAQPGLYINTVTYDVWIFWNDVWFKAIQGFSAWNPVTTYSLGWGDNVADPDLSLKYRLEGQNVRLTGVPYNDIPDIITSDSLIFTLPIGYRPPYKIFKTGVLIDIAGGQPILTPIIEIRATGEVIAKGGLSAFVTTTSYDSYFDARNCFFDVTFSIT